MPDPINNPAAEPAHGSPLSGGPGVGAAGANPPAASASGSNPPPAGASVNPPAGASAAEKEVYLGTRKFGSQAELLAYAAGLQSKADLADRLTQQLAPPAAPQADADDELADMMYSDPKKAIKNIEEKAVNRALQAFEDRRVAQDVRKSFFDGHEDLKGNEDIVDMTFSRMQKELAGLDPVTAQSKLASAVRERLANIRGAQRATEELPNGNPRVVSAGSNAPAGNANPPPAPTNMAEQLKGWQNRGKKAR